MPKKSADQIILRKSCMQEKVSAVFFFRSSFSEYKTRKRDIPIIMYNKVHTGANTHEGGLSAGLLRLRYHLSTDEEVKIDPREPAARHIIIENASFRYFKFFMLFENLLQEGGYPCGRIAADILFFIRKHVEKPVQRF